jgi:hypothetical protein
MGMPIRGYYIGGYPIGGYHIGGCYIGGCYIGGCPIGGYPIEGYPNRKVSCLPNVYTLGSLTALGVIEHLAETAVRKPAIG